MVYTDAGDAGEQLASAFKLSGDVREVSGGTVYASSGHWVFHNCKQGLTVQVSVAIMYT